MSLATSKKTPRNRKKAKLATLEEMPSKSSVVEGAPSLYPLHRCRKTTVLQVQNRNHARLDISLLAHVLEVFPGPAEQTVQGPPDHKSEL
jgi:hypothetical protein